MSRPFRSIIGVFTCLLLLNGGKIAAQSVKTTNPDIIEVYGSFVNDLNQEQIAWINNQLERSTVIKMDRKEDETLPLLSGLPLVTKYISNLQKDDFTKPLEINPIKYRINFMNKKDQTFRIDGTDYVLFVKGKK